MSAKNPDSKNTSQQHGIDFDNLIKTTHLFPGACNVYRAGNSVHDIEGELDPVYGIATSIKTTGNGTIGLADAARFYEINIHHRFIIGEWTQINERKKLFTKIHDIILPLRILNKLRGELTVDQVLDFHKRIAAYPKGKNAAETARAEAKWIKKEIAGKHGKVCFEFKIDDDKQRRLQLSIKLQDMIDAVKNEPLYVSGKNSRPLHIMHDEEFCQYVLPIPILSTTRIIQPVQAIKPDNGVNTLFGSLPESHPVNIATSTTRRTPRRQDEQRGEDIVAGPEALGLI